MIENHIKYLEELILGYVGPTKTIIKTDISNLTADGENYCSVMLKIDFTLISEGSSEREILHTVAKCIKKTTNYFFHQVSKAQFKREIGFYTEILPTLQKFQRDRGVEKVLDIFPNILAFRRNIEGKGDEIDDHAVIIFENLKEEGYSNIECSTGFNLEGAKRILMDLAEFHAIPIALKIAQPDVHEAIIKKHCSCEDFPKLPISEEEDQMPVWLKIAAEYEECQPFIEAIVHKLNDFSKDGDFFTKPSIEPLATIIHNDLWTNNTMQVFNNGKIVHNKILDFQLYQYASPLLDVVFFIFSSVQKNIIQRNFDDLIFHYKNHLIRALENLKCDTSSFSQHIPEVLADVAHAELIHLLFEAIPIFGIREKSAVDFEADLANMVQESSVTEEAKNHIVYIVTEFGKRKWISSSKHKNILQPSIEQELTSVNL